MSEYLDTLANALRDLGTVAFEAVKATVDGDQPILVGAWVSEVNCQRCGCLMMDGIGTKEPWIWEEINGDPALKGELAETADFLAQHFYTNEDEGTVSAVAQAFDDWAMYGHPSLGDTNDDEMDYRERLTGNIETTYILTDEGRKILRELMANLARERALA